jgi:hypothetical protein
MNTMSSMAIRAICTAIAGTSGLSYASAQSTNAPPAMNHTVQEEQVWSDLSLSVRLSDKWQFVTEIQPRFRSGDATFAKFVLQPGIGYKISKDLIVWGGYVYAILETGDGRQIEDNRFWQQANYTIARIGSVTIAGRTRLEQRRLDIGKDTGWRIRERITASVPLTSHKDGVSFVTFVEPMAQLVKTDWGAEKGFDQIRGYAGLAIPLSKSFGVDLGYMAQRQRQEDGIKPLNHILVINFKFSV